jgi:glycosyltransferase involved in cell wall biosynthesis
MKIEVSVVTPTYNRREFIPILIEIYKNQTFSKEKMEWIILDDGTDKVEDLFIEASKKIPNIRYIYKEEKINIGAKRNVLNKEAKGDIIVSMDDDDYYPPTRVLSVVKAFNRNRSVELAGSSEMYMYYTEDKKIFRTGPFGPTHCTNGTMACKKSYALTHFYDETVTQAEEKSFLDEYKHPMIQLNPMESILVICHKRNTFDKYKYRDSQKNVTDNKYFKETTLKIRSFIKEANIRDFYKNLLTQ